MFTFGFNRRHASQCVDGFVTLMGMVETHIEYLGCTRLKGNKFRPRQEAPEENVAELLAFLRRQRYFCNFETSVDEWQRAVVARIGL